jgi:hypothetical protein
MQTISGYDVRIEDRHGRRTLRVAALNPAEARQQAEQRTGGSAVACRRSQYKIGESERSARRVWLARIKDLATYTPNDVLQGWAAGYRANCEDEKAAECEAARELQATWRTS